MDLAYCLTMPRKKRKANEKSTTSAGGQISCTSSSSKKTPSPPSKRPFSGNKAKETPPRKTNVSNLSDSDSDYSSSSEDSSSSSEIEVIGVSSKPPAKPKRGRGRKAVNRDKGSNQCIVETLMTLEDEADGKVTYSCNKCDKYSTAKKGYGWTNFITHLTSCYGGKEKMVVSTKLTNFLIEVFTIKHLTVHCIIDCLSSGIRDEALCKFRQI